MDKSCSYAPNQSTSRFTITPTEPDIFTSIGDWLKTVLPAGCTILQGQQNQTVQPLGLYATMLLITRERLATNDWTYDRTAQTRTVSEPTELAIQVNIFGTGSGDAVHRVHSLWRDMYTTEYMFNVGDYLAPLYATNPRQLGFVTAEKQYADGWSVDLHMQVNFLVTTPQQFAETVTVPIVEADIIKT